MRSSIALVLLLTITGCPGTTVHQVTPDRDGLGTPFGDACTNLRRLGCMEGFPANGRTCYEHLRRRELDVLVPSVCLTGATDRAAVRACAQDDAQALHMRCLDGPDGG